MTPAFLSSSMCWMPAQHPIQLEAAVVEVLCLEALYVGLSLLWCTRTILRQQAGQHQTSGPSPRNNDGHACGCCCTDELYAAICC